MRNGKTRHHRKPVSLGGKLNKRNISLVTHCKHKAWHILFDNYGPLKILGLFEKYCEVFVTEGKSNFQVRRNNEWINQKEFWKKRKKAWLLLFKKMNLEQIIDEVNKTWIDPDYYIVLVKNNNNNSVAIAKKI